MSLDHILLGFLRKPASGYDLKKVFDERIGYFWSAELSQIYPTLQRLEKTGWLRSRPADSKRGRGRVLCETTPAGRRALHQWLASGLEMGDDRFAYFAQLYHMHERGDLSQTVQFMVRLRDRFARKWQALQAIDRDWAECDPRYPMICSSRNSIFNSPCARGCDPSRPMGSGVTNPSGGCEGGSPRRNPVFEIFPGLRRLHIAAGTVALILFWIPIAAPKGGRPYIRIGWPA